MGPPKFKLICIDTVVYFIDIIFLSMLSAEKNKLC